MTYFIFECKNCDVAPAYLADATEIVSCGNCRKIGVAVELTDAQVVELDLPKVE